MKQFVICFSLLILSACSDINLSGLKPQPVNSTSVGSFCTYDPEEKMSYTNYMFIVDYSGSNSSTDPSRVRIDKVVEFYNNKKNQDYTRWGALMFDSNSRAAIYETSQNEPIFTDDEALEEQGMQRLQSESQNGTSTNYSAAIDMANDAITNDVRNHPDRDDFYIIFFLTDGMPNSGTTSTEGLVNKVKDLVGIRSGHIFFSAAYYGGQGDSTKLRKMAEAGGGNFVDIDRAQDLDFSGLIPDGPQKEAWVLKKDSFLVYNLNTAICEHPALGNGSPGDFGSDSDGDGVCDDDEIYYSQKFGWKLDPTKRSTPQADPQTGGLKDLIFSDYFILLQYKGTLLLPPCLPEEAIDDDHDFLNKCEERFIKNATPYGTKYKDFEWKSGNPKDPDTDNDGILDGLEVVLFRSHLGWAMDDRVSLPWSGENISALKKVQMHKNPLMPDRSPAYDTEITEIGTQNGKTCYSFKQNILPLYPVYDVRSQDVHPFLTRAPKTNKVMVYFMQNKFSDPNGKGIYMYSVQELKVDQSYQGGIGLPAGLQINDSVFKPYETYIKLDTP